MLRRENTIIKWKCDVKNVWIKEIWPDKCCIFIFYFIITFSNIWITWSRHDKTRKYTTYGGIHIWIGVAYVVQRVHTRTWRACSRFGWFPFDRVLCYTAGGQFARWSTATSTKPASRPPPLARTCHLTLYIATNCFWEGRGVEDGCSGEWNCIFKCYAI